MLICDPAPDHMLICDPAPDHMLIDWRFRQ
jgi:hypothetical protein